MNNRQVRKYFEELNAESPVTDELIAGGFVQKSGGYISYASEMGIKNPTQKWHLIESWCKRTEETASFNRTIQCGELIFWMAEVSHAVGEEELRNLKDDILKNYLNDRSGGNRKIQSVCFDRIVNVVEAYDKEHGSC